MNKLRVLSSLIVLAACNVHAATIDTISISNGSSIEEVATTTSGRLLEWHTASSIGAVG